MGPSYVPPETEVPSNWKKHNNNQFIEYSKDEQGEIVFLDHWWEVFEDEELNQLEKIALENNRDLYIAFERIQEARALVGIAAADFYPQVTIDPLFTDTRHLFQIFNPNQNNLNCCGPVAQPINYLRVRQLLYFLPLNLNYELDLWGKILSGYNSAKYNWQAREMDFNNMMLSLTSNLAIAYYQIRSADSQLELLTHVIETRKKALKINQDRFDGQLTNYADVTLAAEELDIAINRFQEAERQREVLENRLAVLLGVPSSTFELKFNPLSKDPPSIPSGIPSEILLRRPDIAAADYEVISQHYLVKRAYSLFFPSISLTGAMGFESPFLKLFLQGISRYWMYGARASQIAFDGFRTSSNLDREIANFKQASGQYQQQVLRAFQEVEDALTNVSSYYEQQSTVQDIVKWAQKSYQLYLDRYRSGITDYINVANTERNLLDYQIQENLLQGYRFIATIELIRALGGGWAAPEVCVPVD